MKNILSFDVEEWRDTFCLAGEELEQLRAQCRVEIGVRTILDILRPAGAKATFFVVGQLAETDPNLIRMIAKEGHEIASHSYAHIPVSAMSPTEFKKDLIRSIQVLENISGQKILGYRAPGYTITKQTLWALDIIKECGLRYDSSIYPVSLRMFTRGGAAGFPQKPFAVKEGLMEFPLITANLFGLRVPVATTAYFRLFPYQITKWAIDRLNKKGVISTLNFHSWELDPEQPRIKLPFPHNIKHYHNLDKTGQRLEKLLADFKFVSCQQALVKG